MSFTNWLIAKIGAWLNKDLPSKQNYLIDFDSLSYEVRPGDVILVEGKNRISRLIRRVTHSPWTHAALYIGRLHDIDDPELRKTIQLHYLGPPNVQLLIESMLGTGTVITPLVHYQDHHMRICRPQGLSRRDAQKILAYTINRLGMKYSVRHIVDLFRFLLPYGILPRRWRSTLFVHNALQPTEDICSSMIAHAFSSVNFPILPIIKEDQSKRMQLIKRNPRIYTPSDFDYSPYFLIIKYPLLNIDKNPTYQTLPWKKDTLGIGDEEIHIDSGKNEE